MAILSKWKFLALVLVIPIVALVALACSDDDGGQTEEELVAALCSDLAALQAVDSSFDTLSSSSTVDEVEAAVDVYSDALDDVRSSAEDVAGVRSEPVEDAVDDLESAVNDIPGDATVEEAVDSIQPELAALDAAYATAFSGVTCP